MLNFLKKEVASKKYAVKPSVFHQNNKKIHSQLFWGGASLKYGAEDLTSNVWQTSHTFDGRIFGPLHTICDMHVVQKIVPQCRQCSFLRLTVNGDLHVGHSSTSSSCCHRTCVSEPRIFSNWIYNSKKPSFLKKMHYNTKMSNKICTPLNSKQNYPIKCYLLFYFLSTTTKKLKTLKI